jgi:hypothetical protein
LAEQICEKYISEDTPEEHVVAAYSRLSKVREDRDLHAKQERALYKKMVNQPKPQSPVKSTMNQPRKVIDQTKIET